MSSSLSSSMTAISIISSWLTSWFLQSSTKSSKIDILLINNQNTQYYIVILLKFFFEGNILNFENILCISTKQSSTFDLKKNWATDAHFQIRILELYHQKQSSNIPEIPGSVSDPSSSSFIVKLIPCLTSSQLNSHFSNENRFLIFLQMNKNYEIQLEILQITFFNLKVLHTFLEITYFQKIRVRIVRL